MTSTLSIRSQYDQQTVSTPNAMFLREKGSDESSTAMPKSPTYMASHSRRMRLSNPSTGTSASGSDAGIETSASVTDLKKVFEYRTASHQKRTPVTRNMQVAKPSELDETNLVILKVPSKPPPERFENGTRSSCTTSPSKRRQMRYNKVENVDTHGIAHDQSAASVEAATESATVNGRKGKTTVVKVKPRKQNGYSTLNNSLLDNQETKPKGAQPSKSTNTADINDSYEKYINGTNEDYLVNNINTNKHYQQHARNTDHVPGTPTNGGLSERRRKMAMAKKHARSSNATINNDDNSSSSHNGNIHRDDTIDANNTNTNTNHHRRNSQKQNSNKSKRNEKNDFIVSFQDPPHLEPEETKHENYHPQQQQYRNNHDEEYTSSTSKFPSSPSRRRKFELIKESMKHRRNQQNQQQSYEQQQEQQEQQQQQQQQPLETSSIDGGEIMKLDPDNMNGNANSTTQTLSTASMSTSTFETFESDINLFQQQQQQQNHPPQESTRMKPVQEINSERSTSGEIQWNIDEFSPSRSSNMKMESKIMTTDICDNNNSQGQSSRYHSDKNDMMLHDNNYDNPKFRSVSELHHSPTRNNNNNNYYQNPQYFAPPHMPPNATNTWDDDDETQFNSVSDNNDRRRTNNVDTINLQIHPLQSTTLSTKSDKSTSYFANGFGGSSRRVYDVPLPASNTRDNDDGSYSGSVGNQSWTGRMRANQATHYHGGTLTMQDKQFSGRNESPSKRSIFSNEDNATEISYFSTSQLLTTDIGNTPACVDASKGIEEIKKIAQDDPTTTAVGVGVCGVLCGALAFGPAGFIFAGAAGAACYGVSQLPEEKRAKMKVKASTTVEKIKSQTEVASDFVSNNCGACGSTEVPAKQSNGDNDARSPGGTITSQGESIDGMTKYSPQHNAIKRGSIGGNQHESMQQDTNALLSQATKRKLNRRAPACCRMSRITPVNQIHSLDPSLHSRAWLDVMASAWTSRDEKNEAMEEILLLAKDKNRARMLLEEGILDSLMYILRAFFLTYVEKLRQSEQKALQIENYMADPNFFHSKLAANCCVALAKAHCADVNNEAGDVAYNGGLSLPVQRQVAQLLYEVPHHMAIKAPDTGEVEKKETFKLTLEMTMTIAEDLASSITALTVGKIEVNLNAE